MVDFIEGGTTLLFSVSRCPPVSQKRDAFGDTKKNIGPKELVAECEAWRNRAESEKKFESFKSRPRPIG